MVEGSVIGELPHNELNRMTSETQTVFTQEGGAQSPEEFEGGEKDTLTTTTITGISKTEEQTGLDGEQPSRFFGEPLEIRTKE